MSSPLNKLTIMGFKSIRALNSFELKALNILIGANGAGKSNFVDFFRLLESMVVGDLSRYSLTRGVDSLFFDGPKVTPAIKVELFFLQNEYRFELQTTESEEIIVSSEASKYADNEWKLYPGVTKEARLASWSPEEGGKSQYGRYIGVKGHIHNAISSWRVYHFHDTSPMAPLRRSGQEQDVNAFLSG